MDGVVVYFEPGMMIMGPALQIRMGGFWFLRWLKVVGAAPAPACAF